MDSSENQIKQIQEVVDSEGYALYDVQLSHRRNGVLRIFITAPFGNKELTPTLEACARISKRLLDHPNVEELIPWESSLEVSSPGINRKLKTLEHLAGAVNERVSVKFKADNGKNEIAKGILKDLKNSVLFIEIEFDKKRARTKNKDAQTEVKESNANLIQIKFDNLVEAKADFKF